MGLGNNQEGCDREFHEMPLPREDVDATTPKFLRDKYAIVDVRHSLITRTGTPRAPANICLG